MEPTIERVLAVYSEMLGLSFARTEQLPTWHEEVVAFEVGAMRGNQRADWLDPGVEAGQCGRASLFRPVSERWQVRPPDDRASCPQLRRCRRHTMCPSVRQYFQLATTPGALLSDTTEAVLAPWLMLSVVGG